MLNKKEIKDIQSLSQKKFREETGLFVAEGPKIVPEMIAAAPHHVSAIYALESWLDAHYSLVQPFAAVAVSFAELERISQLQTPNEVLAVMKMFDPPPAPSSGFTLYLDTIQDPGNLGTIIRIADWFNVGGIVCSAGCADRYSAKVVQSTMASLARVSILDDREGTWLQTQQRPRYAAVLEGHSLYHQPKTAEGILLVGNESKGLRPELLDPATRMITIPRRGAAESRNAAVATGIILSHLLN